jgi:hypothetical protein
VMYCRQFIGCSTTQTSGRGTSRSFCLSSGLRVLFNTGKSLKWDFSFVISISVCESPYTREGCLNKVWFGNFHDCIPSNTDSFYAFAPMAFAFQITPFSAIRG